MLLRRSSLDCQIPRKTPIPVNQRALLGRSDVAITARSRALIAETTARVRRSLLSLKP